MDMEWHTLVRTQQVLISACTMLIHIHTPLGRNCMRKTRVVARRKEGPHVRANSIMYTWTQTHILNETRQMKQSYKRRKLQSITYASSLNCALPCAFASAAWRALSAALASRWVIFTRLLVMFSASTVVPDVLAWLLAALPVPLLGELG